MHVIITHTDMDGIASEYVVREYLKNTEPTPIVKFNYNYSNNTSHIEELLDKNIETIEDIYILDVTMPDPFMDKYAKYITWIDHHNTAVERDAEWKSKLKNNFSAITVEGYDGVNGEQAQKISACELTWLKLFPKEEMPYYLFYIGRYDVWDHDSIGITRAIHDYNSVMYAEEGLDAALSDTFKAAMIDSYFQEIVLDDAFNIYKYKQQVDGAYALKNVKKQKIFGKIVATYNGRCTSQFFGRFVQNNDDVEILLNYAYDPYHKTWIIGCYKVDGKEMKALDFIKQFHDVIPDIISLGGHEDACGMRLKQEDIIKFLNTFEEVN